MSFFRVISRANCISKKTRLRVSRFLEWSQIKCLIFCFVVDAVRVAVEGAEGETNPAQDHQGIVYVRNVGTKQPTRLGSVVLTLLVPNVEPK